MPNWIEGTLKLRGKREDIKRFFDEGLEASSWADPKDREDQVMDYSGENYISYGFKNLTWIKDTRRAFIQNQEIEMDDEEGVLCLDVKQAWGFSRDESDLDQWKAISDEYNLDLKLFGVEHGMQFTQEVIIIRGRSPIVNVTKYENWDWDCPFPRMGG